MRPTLSSATATLVLVCAMCEAFNIPASIRHGGGSLRSASRSRRISIGTEISPSETTVPSHSKGAVADDDAGGLGGSRGDGEVRSSYPGPVIPRVGGEMPNERPGWFRVPAPGGKHTKVIHSFFTFLLIFKFYDLIS